MLAVGLAFAPRVAAAADSKAAAKAKLVEGADLLKRGEYQSALERFQRAYELVPSPKIQFNFGLAYKGLGRNAEAIEAFDKFLAEAKGATADSVAKAHKYRDELLATVGRLSVHADVEGASVVVDGRAYGTTPRADEILLDPGPHLLLMERPGGGGAPFTRKLDIAAGRAVSVEAKLAPEPVVAKPVEPVEAPKPSPTEALPAHNTEEPPTLVHRSPEPATGAPRWLAPTAIVTGSLAAVALGFGAYEWVIKEQKFRKFNDDMTCNSNPGLPNAGGGECPGLLADGNNAKRLGYIGFVAGGALGVTAAALFIVRQTMQGPSEDGRGNRLACAPSPTGLGGACAFRF
jgi:hypothetical protein